MALSFFRKDTKDAATGAEAAEMEAFLAKAKTQAGGYYERLLVSMLLEEFAAYKAKQN